MIFVEWKLWTEIEITWSQRASVETCTYSSGRIGEMINSNLISINYYANVYLNRLTEWFKRRIGEKESLPERLNRQDGHRPHSTEKQMKRTEKEREKEREEEEEEEDSEREKKRKERNIKEDSLSKGIFTLIVDIHIYIYIYICASPWQSMLPRTCMCVYTRLT